MNDKWLFIKAQIFSSLPSLKSNQTPMHSKQFLSSHINKIKYINCCTHKSIFYIQEFNYRKYKLITGGSISFYGSEYQSQRDLQPLIKNIYHIRTSMVSNYCICFCKIICLVAFENRVVTSNSMLTFSKFIIYWKLAHPFYDAVSIGLLALVEPNAALCVYVSDDGSRNGW